MTSIQSVIESDLANDPPSMVDFANLGEIPVLSGGFYAAQLKPWLRLFGASNVYVMKSEMLFDNPTPELSKLQVFLGLDPVDLTFPRVNESIPDEPAERTLALQVLREFYERSNRDLFDLLGADFSWSSP